MSALCLMLMLVEGLACPLRPADPTIPLSIPQFEQVLIEAGVPAPLWAEFLHVARCESNLVPAAHAPGSWHYGLYQINWWAGVNPPTYPGWSDWLREVHQFVGDPLDPVDNTRAAYLIYQHSGWVNWQYCRPR